MWIDKNNNTLKKVQPRFSTGLCENEAKLFGMELRLFIFIRH